MGVVFGFLWLFGLSVRVGMLAGGFCMRCQLMDCQEVCVVGTYGERLQASFRR